MLYLLLMNFNILSKLYLIGYQRTVYFLFLAHAGNIDKTHSSRIFVFMFLNNLIVISSIQKTIENNIFEGMISICLNIILKQFKHNLNVQYIFFLF